MAFPSTPILDAFNRANAGPPPGANWSASGDLVVDNNACESVTPGIQDCCWLPITGGSVDEAYVTTLTTVEQASPAVYLFIRVQSTSVDDPILRSYGLSVNHPNAGTTYVQLLKFNGAVEYLATGNFTWQAGDAFGLESITSGGTVTLNGYHKPVGGDWTLVVSDTDALSGGWAGGHVGLALADDTPGTLRLDDFGGGGTLAIPAAPTLLTATAVSNAQINLAWTDNAINEDGFEIERSLNGSTGWSVIDTTGAGVTTRTNTGLSASTTYYYRVRAFNADGYSAYSNIASATTMAIPNAPTLLTATAMSSSRIDLAWTDNSSNETGFKIERGLDGVTFAQIDLVGPNVTVYQDNDLAANTLYYYRVRAFNTDGNSDYSNIASARTLVRCSSGHSYFDVLIRIVRALDALIEGQATIDGSPTTLVDSHIGTDFSGKADDNFNGGTLFWKTHKNSPVSAEAVGSVANANSFSGTLDVTPIETGSVVVATPAGSVTDDGAGAFASAVVTETEEVLTFTVSPEDGTAEAQFAYRSVEPGSVTIKYGLGGEPDTFVTDDDDGNGNVNVWIPITQYVTLGTIANSRSFAADNYPAGDLPITPGACILSTPAGSVTDDGAGVFASTPATVTGEDVTFASPQETPSTSICWLMDGADRVGNVTPGSLTITWDDGVNPPVANTDDGAGNIDVYANGTEYPGTINYTTGVVQIDSLPFGDATWLANNTADFTHDVTYSAIAGTLDYTTGEVTLTFAVAQTGTVSVESLISTPHFVAATIDYDTGVLSLTGLRSGDAAWLDDFPRYGATYEHRLVTGTINYNTGALALTFDRLVTGAITASYTQDSTNVFLPVARRVTDFVAATGTVTFEATELFTLGTGEGDQYGISTRRYPLYILFQKLNEALDDIKAYLIDQIDLSVSTEVINQQVTLSDSVRIHSIWNGNSTTSDRQWMQITRYRHINGVVQIFDYLNFDTLRIKYFADVDSVSNETDCVPDQVDVTWLALEAAVKCCRWRLLQPGADKELLTMQTNDLMKRAQTAKSKLNLHYPHQTGLKLPIYPEL